MRPFALSGRGRRWPSPALLGCAPAVRSRAAAQLPGTATARASCRARSDTMPGPSMADAPGGDLPGADPLQVLANSFQVQRDLGLNAASDGQSAAGVAQFPDADAGVDAAAVQHAAGASRAPTIDDQMAKTRPMINRELTPEQLGRLQQIMLQIQGPCATVMDPTVAAAAAPLARSKLARRAAVCQDRSAQMRAAFQPPAPGEDPCQAAARNRDRLTRHPPDGDRQGAGGCSRPNSSVQFCEMQGRPPRRWSRRCRPAAPPGRHGGLSAGNSHFTALSTMQRVRALSTPSQPIQPPDRPRRPVSHRGRWPVAAVAQPAPPPPPPGAARAAAAGSRRRAASAAIAGHRAGPGQLDRCRWCMSAATTRSRSRPEGRQAATLLNEALDAKTPEEMRSQGAGFSKIYDEIVPRENYGSEYTALQWFDDYLAADDKRPRARADRPARSSIFFDQFSADNFKLLREFLDRKYRIHDIGDEETRNGQDRKIWIEDTHAVREPAARSLGTYQRDAAAARPQAGHDASPMSAAAPAITRSASPTRSGRPARSTPSTWSQPHLHWVEEAKPALGVNNIQTIQTDGRTVGLAGADEAWTPVFRLLALSQHLRHDDAARPGRVRAQHQGRDRAERHAVPGR